MGKGKIKTLLTGSSHLYFFFASYALYPLDQLPGHNLVLVDQPIVVEALQVRLSIEDGRVVPVEAAELLVAVEGRPSSGGPIGAVPA